MIASIEGTLAAKGQGFAIIEVGGIGLRVLIPASTAAHLPEVGGHAKLHTHLLVREDALTLYGFSTPEELGLFELLLGVSGLGPQKALALLSGSSVGALRADIARENTAALMRIPGVGRKLAAQIVLDLKDKVGPVAAEAEPPQDGELLGWLITLGFPPAQAQAAVAKLPKDSTLPLEERVKQALAILRPE